MKPSRLFDPRERKEALALCRQHRHALTAYLVIGALFKRVVYPKVGDALKSASGSPAMRTIGIRVKPGLVTFAIYDGDAQQLRNVETIKIPKALETPDALKYIRNNILDVIREYDVEYAGLRVTENVAKTWSIFRIEIEGVIQEAFASSSLRGYYCGQIATIAARVGMPRVDFKRYVDGDLVFESIENWTTLNLEEREAVLAALGAEHA